MRADSGRRHSFPKKTLAPVGHLQSLRLGIRVLDCIFPDPGVYFLEAWYDEVWLLDQRLEVVFADGERHGT